MAEPRSEAPRAASEQRLRRSGADTSRTFDLLRNERGVWRHLCNILGIDKAVGYTLLGRGWSVLIGPVTLIFVASFLSQEEQGFYYTFGSILALNVFFELGLSYVVLQFVSHERSSLDWTAAGTLTGDATAKSRLASILWLSLKWYAVSAVLLVCTLLPAGMIFFGLHHGIGSGVVWQLPWVWIVLVSGLNLMLSPIVATLEGCGLVSQVASMRAAQGVISTLSSWMALALGWGLYAPPVVYTCAFLCAIAWLISRQRMILSDLLLFKCTTEAVSWRREIWPFQWKIALSWLSGYFIFQLFNPILFAFHGPVIAGQMGMSLGIATAISIMAMAWVNARIPTFGGMIARRSYQGLDRLFLVTLIQSSAFALLASLLVWSIRLYLQHINHSLSDRLLPTIPFGLLLGATVINHIIFSEAAYLRAHKEEPFLWNSVIGAVAVALSTYYFGRYGSLTSVLFGYFGFNATVGLAWATWVFLEKRRLWHSPISHRTG